MSKYYSSWLPRLFAAMFVALLLMLTAAAGFGVVYLVLTYLKFWGIGLLLFVVITYFVYDDMSS